MDMSKADLGNNQKGENDSLLLSVISPCGRPQKSRHAEDAFDKLEPSQSFGDLTSIHDLSNFVNNQENERLVAE